MAAKLLLLAQERNALRQAQGRGLYGARIGFSSDVQSVVNVVVTSVAGSCCVEG